MAEEKISVVIAICNKEKYLRKCIESVMGQTYKNLQIILVDDDSTDDSGKICHEYADKDERVIYTSHPHNMGISEVRNTGIRLATGDYITFIDGDDYVFEGFIETLYKNALDHNADISVCEFIRADEDENLDNRPKVNPIIQEYNDPLSFLGNEDLVWASVVVVWNKLYKKDIFNEIKFPVNRIHQDEFIIHHVINAADKLVYTNSPQYVYVRHEESVMRTQNSSTFYDGYLALSDRIEMLDKKGRPEERDIWIKRLIVLLGTYYENCTDPKDSGVWRPVFRQRLLMLVRKYPECNALLDFEQKVRIDKIINIGV